MCKNKIGAAGSGFLNITAVIVSSKDSEQYRSENSRKNQLVLLESPILKTFSNTA